MEELRDIHTVGKVFTSRLEMANAALLYRPVLELTFMVDAITGKGSPFSFHISNILYHLFAVLLIYRFLLFLKIERIRAFIVTVIFAIHPVNVSVASWIPARNDSLLAIFLIASLTAYLKYLRQNSNRWLIAHFLLYGTALFTKENAVVIPLLILTWIILFTDIKLKKMSLHSFIWMIITVFWLWMRSSPQGDITELPFRDHIFYNTFMNFFLNLGKVFYPKDLSLIPNIIDTPMIPIMISSVLFIVLGIILKKKNIRLALWGIVFFLFVLIIPLLWGTLFGLSVSYEHRIYLPMVGLLIFLTQIRIPVWVTKFRIHIIISIFLFSFILAVKSFYRIRVYRNKDTFTFNALKESPSQWQAYAIRADALYSSGFFLSASDYYSKAINLLPIPDKENLYYALGNCFQSMGSYSKALENYQLYIEQHSDFVDVYFNRAVIYRDQHNYEKAISDFSRAIALSPENAKFYNERGYCYQKIKEYEKSLEDFNTGLEIQPNHIGILNNRSISYFMLGEYEKAKKGIELIESLGGEVHPDFKKSVYQQCQ